jgi:hypothetical protein
MHPTKTRIVYCRDGKRRGKYPNVKFDFLGYCFRPRLVRRSQDGILFCSFNPAVSPSALKAMRAKIRELRFRRRTELSLADIAYRINPLLRERKHGRDAVTPRNRKGEATGNTNFDLNRRASLRPYQTRRTPSILRKKWSEI